MLSLASQYCSEREVTADYRQALARVARSMQAAGITPSMLEDSIINQWLASLNQSPTTRSNYRRMALTLWRYAIDLKLAAHPIGRVAKVKVKHKPPIAWSLDELGRLLAATQSLDYRLRSGCPASLFFEAFIRTGYETGLRFSDLLRLRVDQLRDSRLFVVQNKTGQPLAKVLSAECVACLRQLSVLGGGEAFFLWALNHRWLRVHFQRLCNKAGVSGTPKWLRRSGATAVEAVSPGSAGKFLGHLSPGLANRFYVDPTLLPNACPSPPPIGTAAQPAPCGGRVLSVVAHG
jgi:integrase